jgi:hypothetical protein
MTRAIFIIDIGTTHPEGRTSKAVVSASPVRHGVPVNFLLPPSSFLLPPLSPYRFPYGPEILKSTVDPAMYRAAGDRGWEVRP